MKHGSGLQSRLVTSGLSVDTHRLSSTTCSLPISTHSYASDVTPASNNDVIFEHPVVVYFVLRSLCIRPSILQVYYSKCCQRCDFCASICTRTTDIHVLSLETYETLKAIYVNFYSSFCISDAHIFCLMLVFAPEVDTCSAHVTVGCI